MQSFKEKNLRFTFTLSNNSTFANFRNQLVISGLRASITAKGAGWQSFPEADIVVYGMQELDMIALTALQFQLPGQTSAPLSRNVVQVEANSGTGWSTVYLGQIITAGPDYSSMPNVCLRLHAQQYALELLKPAQPNGWTGNTSAVDILNKIGGDMGASLEFNGVTAQLSDSYFSGTLADQFRTVTQHANLQWYSDLGSNTIAICQNGIPRKGDPIVLSPSTGLVGYPVLDYNRGFLNVRALFNPALKFGARVTIQDSAVKNANGDWGIGVTGYALDSLTPGGRWFSDLLLYPPNTLAPVLS